MKKPNTITRTTGGGPRFLTAERYRDRLIRPCVSQMYRALRLEYTEGNVRTPPWPCLAILEARVKVAAVIGGP